MCIQAVLDATGALRHMNKTNSERPVCSTHPLAPISTSLLFVFDTEWVMSTCEHQGRYLCNAMHDPFAITENDFEPFPFCCQIEQQHFDFVVYYMKCHVYSFIAKVSLERRALGWVLFTTPQGRGVGFVPLCVDSVPFDYCE